MGAHQKAKLKRERAKRRRERRERNVKEGRVCKKMTRRPDLVSLRNKTNSPGFYRSTGWLRARYVALLRSGRKCMACGMDGLEKRLHVDHIKSRSRYPELALDVDNLQVLCEPCNLGKGVWDQTDWRQ